MHKKHTLATLLLAFTAFYITPCCKEFAYPNERESLQNICLATIYKHRISFLPLPPAIRELIPVNIYKQTLNYVLFDEIFKNPTNPDSAKVKELLEAGANPNFVYPLSTFKEVDGQKIWKKTEDMDKAGFCIVAIIARQKEFNEAMQKTMDLLVTKGLNLNQESGNDPYNPPYRKVTPTEYAQQNGNTAFVEYIAKINERAHYQNRAP